MSALIARTWRQSDLERAGVDLVVWSSPHPYGHSSARLPALIAEAREVACFSASTAGAQAPFDPIDSYYVPLSRFEKWVRPGPDIHIFLVNPAKEASLRSKSLPGSCSPS